MTTGLAMIVKDEQAVIERCILSVRDHLDHWTILDTGSKDKTSRIAHRVLGDIPGQYVRTKWNGFGPARTQALTLAKPHTSHVLMLDADMTLEGKLPRRFTADAGMVQITDGSDFAYALPLLTRTRIDWEYRGATHEYLEPVTDRAPVPGARLIHHLDGSRRPAKLVQDLVALREQVALNPLDARAVFYLAQTYRDLGLPHQAIAYYRLRAELAGFQEEAWYARYQLGCLLCVHVSVAAGAPELLRCHHERPWRAEPLRALQNAAGHLADTLPIPQNEQLFVHTDTYAA